MPTPHRILVLDDEPDVLDWIGAVLTDGGLQATAVQTGAEMQRFGVFGDELKADDIAPDGDRLVAVGDGDADRAEVAGERQRRGRADAGLGFDSDHDGVSQKNHCVDPDMDDGARQANVVAGTNSRY